MNITKKELIELVKSNNEFKINSMGRMKKNDILEIVNTYPYEIVFKQNKYELVPKSLSQKQIDRERRAKRRIEIKKNSNKKNISEAIEI